MRTARAWGIAAALVIGALLAPNVASGQGLGGALKARFQKKIDARRDSADTAIARAADKAMDSSLTKTGRAADTVINRTSNVLDTVMNRTESGVAGAGKALTGGGSGAPDPIATDLAAGRAVVNTIEFAPGTDTPSHNSEAVFKRMAKAIKATQGAILIEGHVEATGDAAADQALSLKRAAMVKSRLIAAGVPETRLFTMGFGSMRAAAAANGAAPVNSRIEIARMQ